VRAKQPLAGRTAPVEAVPTVGQWSAVTIPGGVPPVGADTAFGHLLLYRTTVAVPAGLRGRSFFLRLPSFNMIASVIVNGQFCGGSSAPFAIWDCDVTRAIKPGAANELAIAIKDVWYALSGADENAWAFSIPANLIESHSQGPGMTFDFPVFTRPESGILETPGLVAAGLAYTADVFAMPSVSERRLGLQVTVANPTRTPITVSIANDVAPDGGGAVEKSFAPRTLSVPAGGREEVTLTEPWADPALWWPDSPQLYTVVTRLAIDGAVVPLLNIGALVKYPRGTGGLVLNQLRITDGEARAANAAKKRAIVAALLRNMGAVFGDS
jgi:hypothetical protein